MQENYFRTGVCECFFLIFIHNEKKCPKIWIFQKFFVWAIENIYHIIDNIYNY